MKKVIIIAGILIGLILILMIVLPIVFKPQIVNLAEDQVNDNINARVEFDDIGLSFFTGFPNLTADISNITVINYVPFDGDTLLTLDEIAVTIDLGSLIFGDQIKINSLLLETLYVNARVLPDSSANWDIMKETEAAEEPAEESTGFNLAVSEYTLKNVSLKFNDELSGMTMSIGSLNHEGRGDFSQDQFVLDTDTKITALDFAVQGVPYLSNADLSVVADIEVDLQNMKFTFDDNEIRLNKLGFDFDGSVQSRENGDLVFDLTYNALKADFKTILSMIPFMRDEKYAGLEAEGTVEFGGMIKGAYSDSTSPQFELKLHVADGNFSYPEIPTPVKDVAIDLTITNPGETMDQTVVDLSRFYMRILNEPIVASLKITTPMSDPFIDLNLEGKVDLGQVKGLLPLEGNVELSGRVNTDLKMAFPKSAVDNNQPQKVKADGRLVMSNIKYASADLPENIEIPACELLLSPQKATLKSLSLKLGSSDLSASGNLNNLIGYVLSDQTLQGSLSLNSNYFDINPWIDEEDTTGLIAVEMPDKIDFTMTVKFAEVLYDNMTMTNATGELRLKDRVLRITDLKAGTMKGNMTANGTYQYIPPEKPKMSFNLNIDKFDIPEMYKTFVTVQKLAPLANYLQGDLSGKINLESSLGDSLIPDWESMIGDGKIDIPRARINEMLALNQVADKLKVADLKNPTMVDFAPSFRIENGRFFLEPETMVLNNYKVVASGSNGLDMSMDYLLQVELPTQKVSALVNQDLSLLAGETFTVDVNVGGTPTKPTVGLAMDRLAQSVADRLKAKAMSEADKKKQELEDKAKKELEDKVKEGTDEVKDKLKGLFGK